MSKVSSMANLYSKLPAAGTSNSAVHRFGIGGLGQVGGRAGRIPVSSTTELALQATDQRDALRVGGVTAGLLDEQHGADGQRRGGGSRRHSLDAPPGENEIDIETFRAGRITVAALGSAV